MCVFVYLSIYLSIYLYIYIGKSGDLLSEGVPGGRELLAVPAPAKLTCQLKNCEVDMST